jgi:hypothetical protein
MTDTDKTPAAPTPEAVARALAAMFEMIRRLHCAVREGKKLLISAPATCCPKFNYFWCIDFSAPAARKRTSLS